MTLGREMKVWHWKGETGKKDVGKTSQGSEENSKRRGKGRQHSKEMKKLGKVRRK